VLVVIMLIVATARAGDPSPNDWRRALRQLEAKLEQLSAQVQAQAAQLREQGLLMERQQAEIERLRAGVSSAPPKPAEAPQIASAVPVAPPAGPAQQALVQTGDTAGQLETLQKGLAGFRFSGDFRYRLDVQARSGNALAGPLQNIRSRYRLRLNVDKELDPRFAFHLQLSTAPLNNGITNDQDMGATVAKHLFTIAEAYVDFHPSPRATIRGGRMEEVFADNMRFLWDDDVRFNGFHQIAGVPLGRGFLGFQTLEFRSAEYFLSSPNIAVLPANSPFAGAGFEPGKKVRDAMLFHPGFLLKGGWSSRWKHQFSGDVQLYRNPNQIQLASLPAGVPLVVNNTLGVTLSGPMTGAGNATTTPGGAIYAAGHFQVARLAYRLENSSWALWGHSVPAWVDLQVARNIGAGKLRDAFMVSGNAGAVKAAGDVRFLYQYAIKDANSLIPQFTDDDLGTGTGVNIAVHALRFDLGLSRFLQWQNLLFFQQARRASNPPEHFFVPLQGGAHTTFRYLGQLAFVF